MIPINLCTYPKASRKDADMASLEFSKVGRSALVAIFAVVSLGQTNVAAQPLAPNPCVAVAAQQAVVGKNLYDLDAYVRLARLALGCAAAEDHQSSERACDHYLVAADAYSIAAELQRTKAPSAALVKSSDSPTRATALVHRFALAYFWAATDAYRTAGDPSGPCSESKRDRAESATATIVVEMDQLEKATSPAINQ